MAMCAAGRRTGTLVGGNVGIRPEVVARIRKRQALAAEVLAVMEEAEQEYHQSGNSSYHELMKAMAHAVAEWVESRW
jgi:hypothetical protein